jgi:glycosyltransferase involved in cell wall biosynthesis
MPVQELYNLLLEQSTSTVAPDDSFYKTIERLSSEFRSYASFFTPDLEACFDTVEHLIWHQGQLTALGQQMSGRDQQLAERDQQLAELDRQLCERNRQSAERDRHLADCIKQLAGSSRQLKEQQQQLADKNRHIESLLKSYSWRLTAPLRRIYALPMRAINKRTDSIIKTDSIINNTIKTLMCSHNLNHEGAPYSQFEMTIGLKEKGVIEPVVFSPLDGPLRALYESHGIKVIINEQFGCILESGGFRNRVEAFAAFIKDLGVELVYANTLINFHVIAAANHVGTPSIWNIRESEPWQHYEGLWGAELAGEAVTCFQFPYKVIFVAHTTKHCYNAFERKHNFHVIHNGLNLDRVLSEAGKYDRQTVREDLGIRNDELAVLLPGTICERKGQQDLVRAMAQLDEGCLKRIKCFVVGDCSIPMPYNIELHAIADHLPMEIKERLSILPISSEIFKYYKAADIFVCTSRIESYPRVILEAMAFDLPIITTPVFGIKEQVQEDVNALFYPPGNHDALAIALKRLIADHTLRKNFSDNASFVLGQLQTFDEMTSGYATIFREAASRSTPTASSRRVLCRL